MNITSRATPSTPVLIGIPGLLHALVDCACAMIFSRLLMVSTITGTAFITSVIVYNVIAFGLQPVFGAVVDKSGFARWSMVLGTALTAAGLALLPVNPVAAVCTAAAGNAIFHVGGATFAIAATPGKATGPALFVAPGAAGLFCGALLGKHADPVFSVMIMLLLIGAIAGWFTCHITPQGKTMKPPFGMKVMVTIGLLLFFSIMVRALAGGAITASWKSSALVLAGLAAGAVLGKALGGMAADRFGWLRTGIICLGASSLIMAGLSSSPHAAIIAMFSLQATMGLTLAAMVRLFTPYPATAFGICSLALLCGVLPLFSPAKIFFCHHGMIAGMIGISAAALTFALKLLLTSEKTIVAPGVHETDNSRLTIIQPDSYQINKGEYREPILE